MRLPPRHLSSAPGSRGVCRAEATRTATAARHTLRARSPSPSPSHLHLMLTFTFLGRHSQTPYRRLVARFASYAAPSLVCLHAPPNLIECYRVAPAAPTARRPLEAAAAVLVVLLRAPALPQSLSRSHGRRHRTGQRGHPDAKMSAGRRNFAQGAQTTAVAPFRPLRRRRAASGARRAA